MFHRNLLLLLLITKLGVCLAVEELLVEVEVNAIASHHYALVLLDEDKLLLNRDSWRVLHIIEPQIQPLLYKGINYLPINYYQEAKYKLNRQTMQLHLILPAKAFASTHIAKQFHQLQVTEPAPSLQLGYDIFYNVVDLEQFATGYFTAQASGNYNSFTSDMVIREVPQQNKAVRLKTYWEHDTAKTMLNYIVGDTESVAGTWGRPALYGGVQIKTDFDLQPAFSPYPAHLASGQAILPSTLDLYFDNLRLRSMQVDPGPFSIEYSPPIIGAGNVRLVTTDLLGREHVTSLPFYTSTRLLAPSLREYALDVGFIRNNYGLNSNDYGQWMFTYTDAMGVTPTFTREWRVEVLKRQQTVGVSGTWLVRPSGGILYATIAGSHADRAGVMAMVGFNHHKKYFNANLRTQVFSAEFRQLGDKPETAPTRIVTQASAGISRKAMGSLNFTVAQQINRQEADSLSLNLGYSRALNKKLHLNLVATQTLEETDHWFVFANFTYALGKNQTATASLTATQSEAGLSSSISRSMPTDVGYGYQLQATETTNMEKLRSRFDYQNRYGIYSLQYNRINGLDALRANVRGSLSYIKQQLNITKPIDSSFALVEVPELPGVDIYLNNRHLATTNHDGYALLPSLNPYAENVIALHSEQLPLNIDTRAMKQIIVPPRRSGIFAKFAIEKSPAALLSLHLDDGKPVPAGAVVKLKDQSFPVAYDGEVYITGLETINHLLASWGGQQCEALIAFDSSKGPLQSLGPQPCQ